MIYIKIHETDKGEIIAMCDEELIDSVIEEGDLEINIKDYSEFYRGEITSPEKAKSIIDISKMFSLNAIGQESIKAAISMKIIEKRNIGYISGIPYAYAVKLKN
ncbi:MAG: DUF424 family protein [Candidatus Micrarchaeia archaeon]